MTLSSRHSIRNSSPGGLRPSTLPLGHGGSSQYWLSHVDGEETFLFLGNRRDREPNPELWRPPLSDGLTVAKPAISRLAASIVCSTWPKEPTYVDNTSKLPLPTRALLINIIVFYANICFEIGNKRVPGRCQRQLSWARVKTRQGRELTAVTTYL